MKSVEIDARTYFDKTEMAVQKYVIFSLLLLLLFMFVQAYESYDKRLFCFGCQVLKRQLLLLTDGHIFLFCFYEKSVSDIAVESVPPLTQRLSHFHHLRRHCCLNPSNLLQRVHLHSYDHMMRVNPHCLFIH